jgi:hypothetical protein
MSYYKAVFDLNRSIDEKAPEERDIHSKMSVNATFPDPPVPYVDYLAAIGEQASAVDNAQYGGIERIATMRTRERLVDDIVRRYRGYVSEVANGDTDVILRSGFRHTKPRTSAGDMPKVEGIKNLTTELSGAIKLKWSRVQNVGFYEVEVRLVDVKPEAEKEGALADVEKETEEVPWTSISSKPARALITGLKPLSKYELRVRAKGAKGYGPYSDVVVMIVT